MVKWLIGKKKQHTQILSVIHLITVFLIALVSWEDLPLQELIGYVGKSSVVAALKTAIHVFFISCKYLILIMCMTRVV